jgi:hypothetical protein
MTTPPLGRLVRVDLRSAWKHEATHFTPWLATEENIALLAEAVGFSSLTVESTERKVGDFRADIVCRDAHEHIVLIENQVEPTDHRHLGQLLTYAAGLDAATVIWIAAEIREEHRAALDWLNRITAEGFNFFAIEVQLWKIGNSAPAPRFFVASRPNDWSKRMKEAVKPTGLTGGQHWQWSFWEGWNAFLLDIGASDWSRKPRKDNWLTYSVGRSDFEVTLSTNRSKNRVDLALLCKGVLSKHHFRALAKSKKAIRGELGFDVEWIDGEDQQQAAVVVRHATDFAVENHTDLYRWAYEALRAFDRVFRPRLAALDESGEEP